MLEDTNSLDGAHMVNIANIVMITEICGTDCVSSYSSVFLNTKTSLYLGLET